MKFSLYLGIILTISFNLANATESHENQVCFNTTIESYSPLGYSVTSGQPFESSIKISDDKSCLVIDAGRKNSTTPVEWVESGMKSGYIDWDGRNMTYTTTFFESTPDELNFAIEGNLTFMGGKYVCNNLYLGQGSSSGGLNKDWWLFSDNNQKAHTITCTDTETDHLAIATIQAGENHYTFDLIFANYIYNN